MSPFLQKALRIVAVQASIGLVAVVNSYIVGTLVCQIIPGAGIKYLSPLGECAVGILIFLASCGLWGVAHFKVSALFITGALTAGLVVAVLLCFGGGINSGMVVDVLFVWRHTVAPVLCAAIVCLMLQTLRTNGMRT
jgi:hypothetical protein